MCDEAPPINLRDEVEGLHDCLTRGDIFASVHLARLVETDTRGALRPFAEALTARLCDHLNRYAEVGVNEPYAALEDEVYGLIQKAAVDWDKIPRTGRAGEEA
jgi:hypothetical protein